MCECGTLIDQVLRRIKSIVDVREPAESQAALWASLYGGITIAIYAIFYFYLQEHYQAWSRHSRNVSNLILIPGITVLLFAYYQGYRLLKKFPQKVFVPLLVASAVAGIVAMNTPSFYSFDLQAYINYGWQQFRYHANPYCLLVAGTEGFGTDPMFTDTWALNPMPYGFAFAHICRLICEHSNGDLHSAIVLFKLTNFLAWLLLGAVVYFGAKSLRVLRPDLSLYLYAWSPLVMLHSLSGCHNDILMTLPVMMAFLCATLPSQFLIALSLPLLVVGTMIKYAWAIAIPLLLLRMLYRQQKLALLMGSFLAIATLIGISWYYRCDPATIRWVEFKFNLSTNTNSLAAVVQNLGKITVSALSHHSNTAFGEVAVNAVCSILKIFLWGCFAAICGRIYWQCWNKKTTLKVSDVVEAGVRMVLIVTCFISSKFYPWYIMMFFPVSLWLPEKNFYRRLAIVISCTQVFAVTLIGHGHINNFILLTLMPALILIQRDKRNARNSIQSEQVA
jgi:hypothetical protein